MFIVTSLSETHCALARGDGILSRVTSKRAQRDEMPTTRFETREYFGLEDWDVPDTEHLVLHQRHPVFPDWAITATFEVRDTAVLSGLFVYPAAEWSPPGGLTLDVIRKIKLGDLQAKAVFRMKNTDARGYLGIDPATFGARKRPGRRGRTDLDYAKLAQRYVALLDHHAPIRVLAQEEHLAESSVRVLIYNARQRGLLTSAEAGQAGGRLTDKAIRLLQAAGHAIAANAELEDV